MVSDKKEDRYGTEFYLEWNFTCVGIKIPSLPSFVCFNDKVNQSDQTSSNFGSFDFSLFDHCGVEEGRLCRMATSVSPGVLLFCGKEQRSTGFSWTAMFETASVIFI